MLGPSCQAGRHDRSLRVRLETSPYSIVICRALNGDDFVRKNAQRLGPRKAPGFNSTWRFVLGLILAFLLSACSAAESSLVFLAVLVDLGGSVILVSPGVFAVQ